MSELIKFPFPTVDGLLSDADRIVLRDLARECKELSGIYVEVGSNKGLSALCILEGSGGRIMWCFDFFEPEKLAQFRKNIGDAGYNSVLTVSGDFRSNPSNWRNPISFLFLDHDHKYDTTKAAYDLGWPLLVKGGLMVFHDVGHKDYPEATEFILALPHKRHFEALGIVAFRKE